MTVILSFILTKMKSVMGVFAARLIHYTKANIGWILTFHWVNGLCMQILKDYKSETWPQSKGILKPIFHCDAKLLASGPCVGSHPQRNDFALPIPPCWYLKTRKHPTLNLKFVLPNAIPKRKSVE